MRNLNKMHKSIYWLIVRSLHGFIFMKLILICRDNALIYNINHMKQNDLAFKLKGHFHNVTKTH